MKKKKIKKKLMMPLKSEERSFDYMETIIAKKFVCASVVKRLEFKLE